MKLFPFSKFTNPKCVFKMKKFVLLFSLFITCIISILHAQTNNATKKFRLGLKTGLSLSSFTKDVGVFAPWTPGVPASGYSNYKKYFRISSLLGATVEYPVTPSFVVGAKLLYAGRGAAYREPNHSVVTITDQGTRKTYNYYKFKIDYLEVPLSAKWDLSANSNGITSFSLYGGLAPAFVLSQSTSYHSYSTNSASPIADPTVRNGELKYVRPFNLSTVAGFQIAGKRKGSFFVDGRFSHTLLPVFKYATTDEGYNLNTAMWTATLGLGIYLKT